MCARTCAACWRSFAARVSSSGASRASRYAPSGAFASTTMLPPAGQPHDHVGAQPAVLAGRPSSARGSRSARACPPSRRRGGAASRPSARAPPAPSARSPGCRSRRAASPASPSPPCSCWRSSPYAVPRARSMARICSSTFSSDARTGADHAFERLLLRLLARLDLQRGLLRTAPSRSFASVRKSSWLARSASAASAGRCPPAATSAAVQQRALLRSCRASASARAVSAARRLSASRSAASHRRPRPRRRPAARRTRAGHRATDQERREADGPGSMSRHTSPPVQVARQLIVPYPCVVAHMPAGRAPRPRSQLGLQSDFESSGGGWTSRA